MTNLTFNWHELGATAAFVLGLSGLGVGLLRGMGLVDMSGIWGLCLFVLLVGALFLGVWLWALIVRAFPNFVSELPKALVLVVVAAAVIVGMIMVGWFDWQHTVNDWITTAISTSILLGFFALVLWTLWQIRGPLVIAALSVLGLALFVVFIMGGVAILGPVVQWLGIPSIAIWIFLAEWFDLRIDFVQVLLGIGFALCVLVIVGIYLFAGTSLVLMATGQVPLPSSMEIIIFLLIVIAAGVWQRGRG